MRFRRCGEDFSTEWCGKCGDSRKSACVPRMRLLISAGLGDVVWPGLSQLQIKKAELEKLPPPSIWPRVSQLLNNQHFLSIATPKRIPPLQSDFRKIPREGPFTTHSFWPNLTTGSS